MVNTSTTGPRALFLNTRVVLRGKTFLFPLVLFVVVLVTNYYLQRNMLDTRVLNATLRSLTPLMFLAVAQTLVIINGNIDLSIGAIMSLVAAFMVTRWTEDSTVAQFMLILL